MSERRLISSDSRFEREVGYSRAVIDGEWVFVSGTTGFDYERMEIAPETAAQVGAALDNVEAALAQAGCGLADVVRVRYVFRDASEFEPCWPLLRERFGDSRPAATMIEAGLVSPEIRFEVEVTARRRSAG